MQTAAQKHRVATRNWKRRNPNKHRFIKDVYYDKTAGAENNISHGCKWTLTEEALIIDLDYTDHQLHNMIGRSVKAIQLRRSRLRNEGEEIPYKSTPRA